MSMRERLLEALTNRGCDPKTDEDGDIVFLQNRLTFLIVLEEEDPQFVRLLLPAIWRIGDPDEIDGARLAAMEVSKRVKLARVFMLYDDESVWIGADGYVFCDTSLGELLDRLIACSLRARDVFIETMMGG